MGRRGPAPTPTEVLNRRGSWRGKKRGGQPPREAGRPHQPTWFGDAELEVWEWLVARMEAMGVLSLADAPAMARYCRTTVRWRKAEQELREAKNEVYPIRGNDGKVKCFQALPHVSIVRDLSLQLLRLEQEFGLTPAARASLGMTLGNPPDAETKGRKGKSKSRYFVD